MSTIFFTIVNCLTTLNIRLCVKGDNLEVLSGKVFVACRPLTIFFTFRVLIYYDCYTTDPHFSITTRQASLGRWFFGSTSTSFMISSITLIPSPQCSIDSAEVLSGSKTSPKTTCFPSRNGSCFRVMKNCEPF